MLNMSKSFITEKNMRKDYINECISYEFPLILTLQKINEEGLYLTMDGCYFQKKNHITSILSAKKHIFQSKNSQEHKLKHRNAFLA